MDLYEWTCLNVINVQFCSWNIHVISFKCSLHTCKEHLKHKACIDEGLSSIVIHLYCFVKHKACIDEGLSSIVIHLYCFVTINK